MFPQMADFLQTYSKIVERCFTSCCNDFTSKSLSSKEVRQSDTSRRAPTDLTSLGNMRYELHGEVHEALRAGGGAFC